MLSQFLISKIHNAEDCYQIIHNSDWSQEVSTRKGEAIQTPPIFHRRISAEMLLKWVWSDELMPNIDWNGYSRGFIVDRVKTAI